MVNCNNIRHEYLHDVIGVKMTVPVGYNYIPTDIPESVYRRPVARPEIPGGLLVLWWVESDPPG